MGIGQNSKRDPGSEPPNETPLDLQACALINRLGTIFISIHAITLYYFINCVRYIFTFVISCIKIIELFTIGQSVYLNFTYITLCTTKKS